MMRETHTIRDEIRRFISDDLQRDLQAVRDEESLLEAGIIDSLGVLSVVGFIEQQYELQVSEDEMVPENFDSVDAIAAFVARRRSPHVA